jgi:predicted protein tyrosine phosphatase
MPVVNKTAAPASRNIDIRGYGSRLKAGTTPYDAAILAKLITCANGKIDEYRFASSILRAKVLVMIHVSPLSALDSITARLPSYDLLTLLSPDTPPTDWSALACERHIRLAFHDIVEPMPGFVAPDRDVMQAILDFGRNSEPQRALLIHCWAGISRSSAAAFAIACDRNPGFEHDIASELRRRAPSATPNRLMVRLADDLLRRDGRMVEAIDKIGRGAEAREGKPYELPLRWPIG